ncbi:prolyl oligopeptidase family serine peptidase [Sphingomonas montana]|uniref:S9 family peptidase n=1 Tax=Sphingomonas montana TaxID=1843236 RepID=UPI0009FAA279|nr:prolyl oligopeptidase family serine peptidase [Sphingomonas montana]
MIFLLLPALLLAAPVQADLAPPVPPTPIARALAMPTAGGLVGAAGRPRFAWVENRAGVRNLWLADVGTPARRLTAYAQDDGQDLYDLTFDAPGDHVAYVRGGDAEYPDAAAPNPAHLAVPPVQRVHLRTLADDGDRVLGPGHAPAFSPSGDRLAWVARGALWMASVAGGDPVQLATFEGTAGPLAWSPDGTRLLLENDRGNHAVIALFDVAARTMRYLDPGLGNDVDPVFSPDGRHVAFIRFATPPPGATADGGAYWSIRTIDLADDEAREIWAAPPGPGGRYAGTRGRNLYWAANDELVFPWERSGWIHVQAIPATGGTPRALTAGAYEVEGFRLDRTGRALLYTANAGDADRRRVWRRSLTGGPATALTPGAAIHTAPTLGGDAVATIATDATHPAYPALVGPGGTTTPLAVQDAGPAAAYAIPRVLRLRAEDGAVVHAQYLRAPGPGRHPALIFLHGGPRRQMLLGFHPSRYYSNAWILSQTMAAKGYDVLILNYRGGTGYGLAFRDAPGTGRDGASEYRDVRAAGLYLAGRADVDPRRIALWGGSWGGYLTALGLARDSALFAAGVDLHGVHDLVRAPAAGLSPPEQDAARLLQWRSSPIGAIDRWRAPVLLIHGDDDRNVAVSQSILLSAMLKDRGVPHEALLLPDERHGFIRHESWVRAYQATIDFLDRRLRPAAPTTPEP